MTDPNGVVTEVTTDPIGRVLTQTTKGVSGCDTVSDPTCGTDLTTVLAYDHLGPLLSVQEPSGGVTVFDYDARGRVVTTSRGPSASSLQERIETVFNPAGKLSAHRYLAFSGAWAEKRRADYAYDPDGQIEKITYPDTKFVQYTRDPAGRVKGIKDENHATANTTYVFDPSGLLKTVEEKLGNATVSASYSYDAHGDLTSATDPNGNVTEWVFDDFGERLKQTSPVAGETSYEYGLAGELLLSVDARGSRTTHRYDAIGRSTSAQSELSYGGSSKEPITWSYDASLVPNGIGRLSSMTDLAGTSTYRWSRRGQLLRESRRDKLDPANTDYATTFKYDSDGNRQEIKYPQAAGSSTITVAYGYDYAGRQVSATLNGLSLVSSAAYLPYGGLSSASFANGTSLTRTFDARYRLASNELSRSGAVIAEYVYGYDGNSNVTTIGDVTNSAYSRTFAYDDLNRLVAANSGAALWGTGSYSYDAMGNPLTASLGLVTRSLTYGGTTPALTLAESSDAAPPGTTQSESVSSDEAGNETSDSAESYTARGMVESLDGHVFTYDGSGLRVRENSASFNGTFPPGSSRRYWFYTPEQHLLATTGYSDAQSLPITRSFVWFAGAPVVQVDGTSIHYTFTDHLGTPILQTDAAGAISWRAEYEPFGKIWAMRAGAQSDQPLRLPGQEELSPDLYYNMARWYRSDLGRYLSVDPVNGSPGSTQSWNPYSYALANPLKYADPTGMEETAFYCDPETGNCFEQIEETALSNDGLDTAVDALGLAADEVGSGADAVGFWIFKNSGVGDWFAGVLKDDPVQMAEGYGKQILWAAPGGAFAGATRAFGTSGLIITGIQSVAPESAPFAMGITSTLEEFAAQHGAETWADLPDTTNWRPGVLEKLSDPNTQIYFNLDDINVSLGVQRASAGQANATSIDWELLQIRQNLQWWDTIQFWKGGVRVPNPFE